MHETELKFQVPAARSAAVRRAVATAAARTTPLRAVYFDTPALHLAQAHVALRLRLEGSVWVQTLKGRGDGMMQRLEHEVRLPAQQGTPQLDLQRHAGTPAAAALHAALPAGAALQPLYTTEIQRLHRRVRSGGAVIEIAHDTGALLAHGRRAVVDEVEFELVSGPPAALPALALRWVARHGLWWDCRTKSERGVRLALQRTQVPAVPGDAAAGEAVPAAGAWSTALQACLARLLPNAAELADGQGTADHALQLRRALGGLQGLLRAGAGHAAEPAAAHALAAAAEGLDVELAAAAPQALAATVTGTAFHTLLLRTLALSLQPG